MTDLAGTVRAIHASGPHAAKHLKHSVWFIVLFGGAGFALLMLAYALWPQLLRSGRKLDEVIVMAPIGAVLGLGYLAIRGWYERGTYRFAFPFAVTLPDWGVWSTSSDVLVLARGSSTAALIRWPKSANPEDVLVALDPSRQFSIVETAPDAVTVRVDAHQGVIRRLGADAYLFVAGPEAVIDARPREPGERVQAWRPLESTKVAAARVVR